MSYRNNLFCLLIKSTKTLIITILLVSEHLTTKTSGLITFLISKDCKSKKLPVSQLPFLYNYSAQTASLKSSDNPLVPGFNWIAFDQTTPT